MLRPRLSLIFGWVLLIHAAGLHPLLMHAARGADEALEWKLEVGDEHHFRLTQAMNMAMDLGPAGDMAAAVTQKIDAVWKIEARDEAGAATVTHEVRRIQMEIQAPGELNMTYDSASPEAPVGYAAMVAPTLQTLIASPFKMAMTPRGAITSVEVPEKIKQAVASLPGAKLMGNMVTGAGLRSSIQQIALLLPEPADLVPGHQWTTTAEMPNPLLGKVTAHTTYTYVGPREVEGQVFEVFKPRLELDFGEAQGAEAVHTTVEDQKTSGEILFNRTRGWLESSLIEQHMILRITAGERQIKQTLDQKVGLQRVEADGPAAAVK